MYIWKFVNTCILERLKTFSIFLSIGNSPNNITHTVWQIVILKLVLIINFLLWSFNAINSDFFRNQFFSALRIFYHTIKTWILYFNKTKRWVFLRWIHYKKKIYSFSIQKSFLVKSRECVTSSFHLQCPKSKVTIRNYCDTYDLALVTLEPI